MSSGDIEMERGGLHIRYLSCWLLLLSCVCGCIISFLIVFWVSLLLRKEGVGEIAKEGERKEVVGEEFLAEGRKEERKEEIR